MDTAVKPRAAKKPAATERQDLRAWIPQLRAAGELQDIDGAEREREISGIVDIYQRRIRNKAVLFDDIPGYPRGHRILANILTSVRRINITLGLDNAAALVHHWRRYMKEARAVPPVTVRSGPVMENTLTGSDIDIFKIPVPRWHEHDGGYYIGTGDMVIMRDPDTGWINYGAYRVQAQGRNAATVMCSKGKHGDLIRRRYHERGEPCPVAVVCGMHPALFMIVCLEIPYGRNEFDAAGGLIGEPVEVIAGPRTGLPIPAHAEIDGQSGVGDVHALRSARGHGDTARLLVDRTRLWCRRSAQRACGSRRLQAGQMAGYFPRRGARQQGGRGSRSQ